MGNWTGAILPATGQGIAIDTVPGQTGTVETQVFKLDSGSPTASQPVTEGSGLPVYHDGITDVDLAHYLETLQNVDKNGVLNVDIGSTMTGGTITTVTGVTTLTNMQIGGIGIEQLINPAEMAYNTQISAALAFT